MEDFEYVPVFERHGGRGQAGRVFGSEFGSLIDEINFAIAA